MARRGSKNKKIKNRKRDISNNITNLREEMLYKPLKRRKIPLPVASTKLITDRRRFNPLNAGPLLTDGRQVEYRLTNTKKKPYKEAGLTARQSFDNPLKVEVCIRRKKRRLVLFRASKIGNGKKIRKKHRWNEYSSIKC